jgi:hypothetical protein
MTEREGASASAAAYEPKILAKKFRISIDEATKIIAQHGSDRKAIDKAARRLVP